MLPCKKEAKKNTLQPCPFTGLQTEACPSHHGALIVPEDPPKEKDDQYGNGKKTIPFMGQLIGQFGHDLKSTSCPWHHHIRTKDRLQSAAGRGILKEYVGQEHLLGTGGLLEPMLQSGDIPSLILWGPPGVGKTTLARLLTESLDKAFYTLSAVHSGVKEVRETIKKAKEQSLFRKGRPILFIDELHRFSKSQQDSLLGAVEDGSISLIGATTENPGFEVIPAPYSPAVRYSL